MKDLHRGPASSANDWDDGIDLSHELDLAAERPSDERPRPSKVSSTVIAFSVVAASLVTAFSVNAIRAWRRADVAPPAAGASEPIADSPRPGSNSSVSTAVVTSTSEPAAIEDQPAPQAVVGRAVREETVVARDAGSGRAGVRGTSSRPRPPRAGGLSTLPQLSDDVDVAVPGDDEGAEGDEGEEGAQPDQVGEHRDSVAD